MHHSKLYSYMHTKRRVSRLHRVVSSSTSCITQLRDEDLNTRVQPSSMSQAKVSAHRVPQSRKVYSHIGCTCKIPSPDQWRGKLSLHIRFTSASGSIPCSLSSSSCSSSIWPSASFHFPSYYFLSFPSLLCTTNLTSSFSLSPPFAPHPLPYLFHPPTHFLSSAISTP